MTNASMRWGLWIVVLLAAMAFRSVRPDWDEGIAAHPDERYLLGVAQDTPLLGNVCRAAPQFPYGHLPVLLAQLVVAAAPNADPLYAARLVSALVGVLLVVSAGAAARLISGRRTELLAATVAALAPGLIQQGHFYTVDPLAAVFATGSVLMATRRRWPMAGVLTGLAVASKSSLVVGAFPLLLLAVATPHVLSREDKPRGMPGWRAFRFGVPAALAFALASPWAVLTPNICWEGPIVQGMLVSGRYTVPYTQQYVGTKPWLYPLAQMALWGLGPAAVTLGGIALIVRAPRILRSRSGHHLPALLWTVTLFLVFGGLQVKFPRYLLPLYPMWIAWAVSVVTGAGAGWLRRLATELACGLLLLSTAALGLAQLGVYDRDHPWWIASGWVYRHLDVGATIAVEGWEHPLPVPMPEGEPAWFRQVTLPVYEPDSPSKRLRLVTDARADIVVIASRRAYGALSQQPSVYAETLDWYADLFVDRSLMAFTRCPHIGPLAITDDPLVDAGFTVTTSLAQRCGTPYALRLPRLDESFRVYDAPMTGILIK